MEIKHKFVLWNAIVRWSKCHIADQFYQCLTKNQRQKLWGVEGPRIPFPRIEIVGESDTLSVDLDQCLVKLS